MVETSVIHEMEFDSVYGNLTIEDFMKQGFDFGDSVDVSFSTGYTFKDIPFYDGYYVKTGDPLVVGYPGYPHIDFATNNKANCYQNLELSDGDTMTITLNEKRKYLVEQETFSIKYFDERDKYSTDEVFANFRAMKLSTMKDNIFYRGASPVDNQHNRAAYADQLIKEAGVDFILDLADNEDEINSYIAKEGFCSQYALNLYNEGNIALLDMGADFKSSVFRTKLVSGLTELINHDGPFYVHCTEGKDRTGFVCFLLGALTNATYNELEADYMITYDNYYGITNDNNLPKYQAIVNLKFMDFVNFLAPDASTTDTYKNEAIQYLIDGGMNINDINALISIIQK